jgi:hypothetical protein
MRLTIYAAFLGFALSGPLCTFAATEPAEAPPAEPPESASAEKGASADVAGWRLCPSCAKLNGPEASFCIYCGRDLDLGRSEAATRRGPAVTLEPSLSFFFRFTELGPGFSFAAEGGRVREEITMFAALDVDDGLDYDGVFFASGTHLYLTDDALRPYAAVDVSLWAPDSVIAELGPGAGVRYDYGRRGSFFYCGAGFGAQTYRVWQEHGPDTYEWDAQFWAKSRLTHYYADFAGVSFAAQTFFGGAVITVGHAFTF